MTFTELVDEVMARTRQTSTEAETRIGREVNDRYRRVTSSIGLATSRRFTTTVSVVAGDPAVTFPGEKLLTVFFGENDFRRVLGEITPDEWRNSQTWAPAHGTPTRYAIWVQTADSITIHLDPVPDASPAMITADILTDAPILTASDTPAFAASFHDVLMHGALADEWMQLKQDDLSKRAEGMYEARLSDLRMFIAKSSYLNIVQGGRAGMDRGPYWPAYLLPRWWR
jgi:hypothetical protein